MGSKYSVTVPSLKVHKTNMVYYATDGPKKSAQDQVWLSWVVPRLTTDVHWTPKINNLVKLLIYAMHGAMMT